MDESSALEALEPKFLAALHDKEAGRLDEAEEALRAVLEIEPRLPEPRMELARLLLDSERVDDAVEQARTALEHLDNTGPWNDDLPAEVVGSIAHALLAECLRRHADSDAVLFGDPAVFQRLLRESKEHFAKAAELDPTDETSSYYAFFLGAAGHGGRSAAELGAEELASLATESTEPGEA